MILYTQYRHHKDNIVHTKKLLFLQVGVDIKIFCDYYDLLSGINC